MRRNIVLELRYDGTNYCGWQKQKRGHSIEEVVEKAVAQITGEEVPIIGCGRTDGRVHAMSFICNFKTESKIPVSKFPLALNRIFPKDISCTACHEEDDYFHSRFSCVKKTYLYKIYCSNIPNPFYHDYSYFCPKKLNLEHMQQVAGHFVGTLDFSAFMAQGSFVNSTIRTIYSLDIGKKDDIIEIEVTGNGFLYNMVRIIVGTLIKVGIGKIKPSEVEHLIASHDRTKAGFTAQPQGLYLKKVYY